MAEVRQFVASKSGRLDKLLADMMSEVTRSTIQRWISEGLVLVDGEAREAKFKLVPGHHIEVTVGPPQLSEAIPDPSVVLNVVHEDEYLLVIDKPARLVVHPGRGHSSGTLVNGLLARPGFECVPSDPGDPEGFLRPGIVHRIDKDTSGLLVVAKTAEAREELKLQFQAHTIERSYVALTMGTPTNGRLDTMHGRDPKNRLKFSTQVRDGKRAVTNVAVRESFFQGRAALVECRLETGRTHQIRVHLSEVRKTPILADELYGGFQGPPEVIQIAKELGRHALHARVLGFVHPETRKSMHFESPIPEDMSQALEALRAL